MGRGWPKAGRFGNTGRGGKPGQEPCAMAVVEAERLARTFGRTVAVDGIDLSVDAGEVFGLVGPNGTGKSTTIKMLATLLPPTSGAARVAGLDVKLFGAMVRREIGYVPQMLSADGALTGYENALIYAKLYDVPEPSRRAREMLRWMGLEGAAERLVREYSGGMIRRLEIGQALLHNPKVLFLDEPTVGLDPSARRAVWDRILELRGRGGVTIFMTTHMMEEADRLCDRIAVMRDGRIAAVGSPRDLKASLGAEGATLDDVFIRYAGTSVDSEGDIRETARARRVARRVG